MQSEFEIAVRDLFFSGRSRVLRRQQVIRPTVPKHYTASAIVARGNHALKAAVFERMVLDHHCEPLLAWLCRGAFLNGPALQEDVHFQTQIVMKMAGVVALHAKRRPPHLALGRGYLICLRGGFGSAFETALFSVAFLLLSTGRHTRS